MPASLPVVLSIAGSDNSAGAGAQADLKTMSALGVYGVTAITCVVAEVPGRVSAIQPIEARIVAEQIRLLFRAFPVAALKTGMLYSRALIAQVCDTLEECFAREARRPFLVVDPVMVASSGDPLLEPDAIELYKARLFPLAGVVTPNLDEAGTLLGRSITSLAELRVAGEELVALHGTAFLLKGAHLRQAMATDLLFSKGFAQEFTAPFVPNVSTHGTGCTYSAAIAAGVGRGLGLPEAVAEAKGFVTRSITEYLEWERPAGRTHALHHFAPRG
ncbi:MAG: bifunctional hydroxymethylpyrimidine kinase/phosphomethylpyrimidine kinase [Verrucomicrobiota bacterium]|nr:bifunctional hydroxymethylpyrimidine kinase/phosphomethylpyrimidine kinase [Verrucomicrobiota bacterium]